MNHTRMRMSRRSRAAGVVAGGFLVAAMLTTGFTVSTAVTAAPAQPDAAPRPAAPATTFVETFTDGEGWLDRWDTHAHFRGEQAGIHPPALTPWRADHDHDCGPAHSERQISTADRDSFFYICRDHLMTSMGDVDGYSTLAFAPKQTFPTVSRVCWDQNVTDLGGRQWTELVITPAANLPGDGRLAHVNPWRQNVDDTSLPHGDGTVGISIMQRYDGFRAFVSRQQTAHSGWNTGSDPEGFESRSIRRQHCLIDNQDGTITFTVDRGASGIWTRSFAGSFPTDARVIFEDHNYVPDKDGEACREHGELTGCRYTWHWDNIIIDF